MRIEGSRALLLAALLVTAGCGFFGGGSSTGTPTGTPTDAPEPTTQTRSLSAEEARQQASDAEMSRVGGVLNATRDVTSVDVSGTDATVLGWNGSAARVRVVVSYAYDCEGETGTVDGSTTAVYRTSPAATGLVNVSDSIAVACE